MKRRTDPTREALWAASLVLSWVAAVLAVIIAAAGCSSPGKIRTVREKGMTAGLSLADDEGIAEFDISRITARRDTFTVRDTDGREVIIMKAVRDEQGEMVAHDVIDAAVVTARFRNVAERHGRVGISFNITVPEGMQDSRWQLRFFPDLFVLEDSTRLEPVLITGAAYRRQQIRGYELYDRFLSTIITDSLTMVNRRQLEIFLHRNIPQVYAYRNDSTFVDEDRFNALVADGRELISELGVTKDEAVEHYTDKFTRWLNRRRIGMIGRKYSEYVKSPIITEGVRLDTVMRSTEGDFIYCYTTTIRTRPMLRKADVVLSGNIWDQDRKIYDIPRSEPLTFYISSLAAFVDNTERYMTKVTERKASANTACQIDFELGRDAVKEDYMGNAGELSRIKGNILALMEDSVFDIDSIFVTASASPEGTLSANERLSSRRSKAVADYMDRYMRHVRDSLDREHGYDIDEQGRVSRSKRADIPFRTRTMAENWTALDALVEGDENLTDSDKEDYRALKAVSNPDARELAMSGRPYYRYVRETLYPKVRTVRFEFNLSRKGMVKDTVHTTQLDSTYMEGVQAIRDRDYEKAVTLLRPYNDYNAAVAFCCMDYNESALAILKTLKPTAQVNYMLAVIYARKGEARDAVQHYMRACEQEPSYVHRGNLDPEISSLIRTYGLNRQDEEYEDYL